MNDTRHHHDLPAFLGRERQVKSRFGFFMENNIFATKARFFCRYCCYSKKFVVVIVVKIVTFVGTVEVVVVVV